MQCKRKLARRFELAEVQVSEVCRDLLSEYECDAQTIFERPGDFQPSVSVSDRDTSAGVRLRQKFSHLTSL